MMMRTIRLFTMRDDGMLRCYGREVMRSRCRGEMHDDVTYVRVQRV